MKSICEAQFVSECVTQNCKLHPQQLPQLAKFNAGKSEPTKFCRFPLPICWFVAGIQFLAAIDWPQQYYKFCNGNKQDDFSKLFELIKFAKFDVSGKTFKAAHIAKLFIKKFKTNLDGDEQDWTLNREQDAGEFVITFLNNIDKNCKETPKGFFNKRPTQLQKHLIDFRMQQLSITESALISCVNCKNHYAAGGDNIYQQALFWGLKFRIKNIQIKAFKS